MKKLLLLILFCNYTFAQEVSNSYSKWYLKPAVGINIPLSNLYFGRITDHLLKYDDHSYYWQVLSASYFFSPHWGIDFLYQGGHSSTISQRSNKFNAELQERYGDDYFVSPASGAAVNSTSWIGGSIQRGYLGVVYRREYSKLIVLPKLLVNVTSFYVDWGGADLKVKGENTVYKLSYKSDDNVYDNFTLVPSISLGFRLSKSVIVNCDVFYAYFKTNIEFIKEWRNTFTNEIALERIDYKSHIHTLTIGMGLIIELKHTSDH